MPSAPQTKPNEASWQQPISLKELARHLNLSPATVSVVLNDVPGRSISAATRERVRAAAAEFNYRPSLLARSLRRQQTMTIGVLMPEVAEGFHAQVLGGVADELERSGYSYLITQHRHNPERVEENARMLISRGSEGIIAMDTEFSSSPHLPAVAVAGHAHVANVTNVVLDHDHAAHLTVKHLYELGHREIACIRGPHGSTDSDFRWNATVEAARKFSLEIRPALTRQIDRDIVSPDIVYPLVKDLVTAHHRFTALVCFNDLAAIGALRALRESGKSVPGDVSVVGFDDIRMAAYSYPSITTIKQPLQVMGETAARILLDRLVGKSEFREEVAIEPELIVRESTATAKAS